MIKYLKYLKNKAAFSFFRSLHYIISINIFNVKNRCRRVDLSTKKMYNKRRKIKIKKILSKSELKEEQ